ncbi:MAG TPA: SDR family oxidoreductase [Stellaceae bacterium]|nr:SDR family oxidoreductase [Stellaceae bacterium]
MSEGQSLRGQKALVTGAASGIGRAIALAFAKAGAEVIVNGRPGNPAIDHLAAEITESGARAVAIAADVSREAEVESLFSRIRAELGTIDILVNNAGLQRDAGITEMTLAQWNEVIAVNLTGQFLCARAAIREMVRRGKRPEVSRALGKILCISSVHEIIPWAGHVNYASSKGGVMMLMKSLAQEVAPLGIRVNGIAPGAIRTPINRQAWETPEALAALNRLIPYGRIGEPEEVARAALFLVSDDSDYIVGTTLFIDGGMTLYPDFAQGG